MSIKQLFAIIYLPSLTAFGAMLLYKLHLTHPYLACGIGGAAIGISLILVTVDS